VLFLSIIIIISFSSSYSSYSFCTTASSHQSNQKVNSRNKRQLKETDTITEYERDTHTERINAVMIIQASTGRKQQQRQQPPRLLRTSLRSYANPPQQTVEKKRVCVCEEDSEPFFFG
jgi:hypothetical protein